MSSFQNLTVDHVRFYTLDINSMINEFRGYGFGVSAEIRLSGNGALDPALYGTGRARLSLPPQRVTFSPEPAAIPTRAGQWR